MDILKLINKYRSDFLPLNLQMFASGTIPEQTGNWNGTTFRHRPRFTGSYTQNLDNGTTTVTVNAYVDLYSPVVLGDVYGTYRFYLNSTGGAWYNQYFSLQPVWYSSGYYSRLLKTDARTINCNADGTFNQYNIQAYGELSADEVTSGSLTGTAICRFPTIPSKIGSIANFNESDTIVVPITRFNDEYRKKLIILINNVTIREIDNISTNSLSITFSNSELQTIYANSTDTNTPIITFKLETYTGENFDELYYTSQVTPTCTLSNTLPVLSNITYNSSTSSVAGDNVVPYISNITIACDLTLQKSSTFVSIKCNGSDMSYVSGDTYSILLSTQNTDTFIIEVIDSRGNTLTHTITKTLLNYIAVTQSAYFRRTSNTSGKILLDYSGNFWSGNFGISNNAISVSWKYRESGSNTWINGTSISSTIIDSVNNTYSNTDVSLNTLLGVNDNFFDYTKNYEFQLTISDLVLSTIAQYSLNKGIPNTVWYEDGYMDHNGDINISGNYLINGQDAFLPLENKISSIGSYSLSEVNTGMKFEISNGVFRDIYRKVVYLGNLTSGGQFQSGITDCYLMLDMKARYTRTNTPILQGVIPMLHPTNSAWSIGLYDFLTDTGSFSLNVGQNQAAAGLTDVYVFFEYVKSS